MSKKKIIISTLSLSLISIGMVNANSLSKYKITNKTGLEIVQKGINGGHKTVYALNETKSFDSDGGKTCGGEDCILTYSNGLPTVEIMSYKEEKVHYDNAKTYIVYGNYKKAMAKSDNICNGSHQAQFEFDLYKDGLKLIESKCL